jgi:hypothetical protein
MKIEQVVQANSPKRELRKLNLGGAFAETNRLAESYLSGQDSEIIFDHEDTKYCVHTSKSGYRLTWYRSSMSSHFQPIDGLSLDGL